MNDALNNLMRGISPAAQATTPAAPAQPVELVDLALPLFDFQVEAVEHAMRDMVGKPYGYIGLDMGLGKTPCGIAVAASLAAVEETPVLVVVPPSLRVNWTREFFKFAPWLKTATITGSKPEPGDVIPDGIDVLIMGDAGLTGWADFLTGKVRGIIVDEAHRFKNQSKRTAALVQLATGKKRTKDDFGRPQVLVLAPEQDLPRVRVLMSGTPVPNGRHQELATQVDVLGDGAWRDIGGKGKFWNHYAPQVDQWGGRASQDGEGLFHAMSNSWFFRRLRGDVLELPAKGRTALHLEGQGKAVREYKKAEADLIEWLREKQNGQITMGQRRAQALIKLMALRKLAGEAKVKAVVEHVKELLDEHPGGVFVVAEHRDVMDGILIGLSKYNPTTVQGGMTDADKADNVDRFCSGESRVLVGQITAAGVGLTLHGGGLNHHVVVAQLPWTPADLKQAEDRLHRIGQTHEVQVEVALAAIEGTWTIDERLWGMLEKKNFASTQITDGDGEFLMDEVIDGLLESYR